MAKVLVTGGAGYIGAHTCKALSEHGFEPVVYDNLCRGRRDFVQWGAFEHGSIGDAARLTEVIARHQPRAVMHFAAYAYVGESTQHPAMYFNNNVAGTLSLLGAMRAAALDTLVFSSTCATYGLPNKVPIPVDHPQRPINPYGLSKLMVERILNEYATAYGLRCFSLRYFNAAGADPDGQIGESHDPETHAAPLAIFAALGLIPCFRVFGDDYDTPDGTAIRDYIHVDDLARAHVLALESLLAGSPGGAVNLGTGAGTSVLELLRAVEDVSGGPVPVEMAPRRAGDPPVLVADPKAAQALLDWTPEYRSIRDIIATAFAWHSKTAVDSRTCLGP